MSASAMKGPTMKRRVLKSVAAFAVATVAIVATCLIAGCSVSVTSDSATSGATASGSSSSTAKSNGPASISAKAATANSADKDGVLTVGFDQDFPPYGYVGNDGNFTGLDLELAAEVAARNGWTLNCVPIDWDAKDTELNSGAIDCIWNGFTIEGRESGYAFTDAYMNNSQVVVVRKNSGITSLAGLAGKVVMAQADSAAYTLLSTGGDQVAVGATFAKLQTTPEYNTAFMELESGAVDAVAIDEPVAKFQISGKEDTYTILSEKLSTEHYGVGFATSNTAERDQVQKTLLEMVKDGTVKTICSHYSSQGVSYDAWCLGV